MTDTRPQFEDACWAHYQGLKARGWSHPEEGDPNSREALFWRGSNGQYGRSRRLGGGGGCARSWMTGL